LGEKYAYYVGWFMTMIYSPSLTGVLAWLSARYLCVLIGFADPVTGTECMLLSGLFLILGYALNALSPILAGKFQVSGTVIKLVPLLLMAVVGTVKGLGNGQLAQNFTAVSAEGVAGSGALLTAVVALAFAYEGWIIATSINAELKNAKRNLPIALVLGSLIVVAVYVCYYLGICGAISVDELMASSSEQAFVNTFGQTLGVLLTVFIVISCACTMNGLMLSSVRGMYSFAVRGLGPKPEIFSAVDKYTNMPMASSVVGLVMSGLWLVYFYGANLTAPWFGAFCFDSSELPIITIYALYIPIFVSMYKDKEQGTFKRYIVPTAALCCSLFMVYAAIIAHGKSIPYYLAVFAVIMALAIPFSKKKSV
ncbi:MAG: APC family permease, partial [Oscillospiraceae bacterium]|nr:APC family permease [Oscillospiraceae bacterium]